MRYILREQRNLQAGELVDVPDDAVAVTLSHTPNLWAIAWLQPLTDDKVKR